MCHVVWKPYWIQGKKIFVVGETAQPIDAKFNESINDPWEIWFDKDDVIGHVLWQPYWIKGEKKNNSSWLTPSPSQDCMGYVFYIYHLVGFSVYSCCYSQYS